MYRKADLNDCNKIYSLVCDLEDGKFLFEKFYKVYNEQINGEKYYLLVYEQNNTIQAFLNIRFKEQLHHRENIAKIMEFIVDSSYRNQEIGKKMFEKAIQISKEYRCSQIKLSCNQFRTDAHRFYVKERMNNSNYKFSKKLTECGGRKNMIDKIGPHLD